MNLRKYLIVIMKKSVICVAFKFRTQIKIAIILNIIQINYFICLIVYLKSFFLKRKPFIPFICLDIHIFA
jgi:hypothetical protein